MDLRFYQAADLLHSCAEQGMVLSLNHQDGLSFQYYGQGECDALLAQIKANKSVLVEYLQRLDSEPHQVPYRANAQQWLLYSQQVAEQNAAFNIALQFEVTGGLTFTEFKAWAETLVQRQSALKSAFVMHEGQLYVHLNSPVSVTVGHHSQPKELDRFKSGVFDLQNGPLFRFDWVASPEGKRFISLVFHHLVFDGHSLQVLIKDVEQFLGKAPSTAHHLPDTAPWLNQVNKEQVDFAGYLESLKAFEALDWQQTFGVEPKNQGMAKLHRHTLTGKQFLHLKQLAQKHHMTPFALQTAITALLLGLYNDSRKFLLFMPADKRTADQLESMGHFVQMLAIKCDLNLQYTVERFLSSCRGAMMQSLAQHALSYDNASYWASDKYQIALPPIRAVIAQQALPQSSMELTRCGAKLDLLAAENRLVKYPLVLNCQSDGQTLQLEWEYDSSLFETHHIKQMQRHWLMILDMLSNQHTRLFELLRENMLAEYHRAPLEHLTDAPRSVQTCWQDKSLVDIWQNNVARYGERKAVWYGDDGLSYRELDCLTNKMARRLVALGVKRESKVVISLGRGLDLICGILAIVKTGGIYVPVDPKAPVNRIHHICEDSGADWILCDENWQFGEANTIDFAEFSVQSAKYDDAALSLNIRPNDAAYIIYTSGSTGLPKGVVVEHHNVVRLIGSAVNAIDFNKNDVWSLFHSFAFDYSVWEIFGALLTGGALAIVPDECLLQPTLFHRFLRVNSVSVLSQTPSAFYNLIDADAQSKEPLSNLRYVIFGGEALSFPRLTQWQKRYQADAVKLVNMYGITETTVHTTHYTLCAEDHNLARSIIGRPLSDLSIYLLGSDQLPLPAGVKGEIYVAGPGVAREYLNMPDITSQRFITLPGLGRLYKSGDFARLDEDGQLVYLGRKDDQVKIRGYRIELEEIRQQLMFFDTVSSAVVTKINTGSDDKLIAFVIPEHPTEFNVVDLRRALATRLPQYMIPAIYHPIDSIPLTTNGKADIKMLLSEYKKHQETNQGKSEGIPEHPLYSIIAEMLGVKSVGTDDNLFSLGLDSISCIMLVNRAREQGIHITVADIYRELTPGRLLSFAAKSGDFSAMPPEQLNYLSEAEQQLVGAEYEMVYPLTRLQQGMLYHSHLDGASGTYHDVFGYRLNMNFDVEALRRVIASMMQHHPVLRTKLIQGPEQLLQGVASNPDIPLQVVDLEGDIALALEQYQAFVKLELAKGFDQRDSLLYRLYLHRFSDGTEQLTLSFHHALLDGWSVANFNTELLNRYKAPCKYESEPKSNGGNYRDYVFAELSALADESHRQFWRNLLRETQVSELPSINQQALPADAPLNRIPCRSFEQHSDAILASAKNAGVTVRQWMLTMHLVALSMLIHNSRVNSTVVYNNRLDMKGGETQLGLFLNSLPFDITLCGESWQQALQQIVTLDRQIVAHRALPADEIQKISGLSFQSILFNYTDFHVYDRLFEAGLPLVDSTIFESVNFPLTIDCGISVQTRQLKYEVGFDGRKHARQSVLRYVSIVDALCQYVTQSPDSPLPHWQALFPDEALTYQALHQTQPKVEQRAVSVDPELTALMMGDRRVSYSELNSLVAQLEQSLVIEQGTRVLLHLPKSIEFVVWLLACMRKELVVIPLPLDLEPTRLKKIIEHADAAYMVSHCPQSFGYDTVSDQMQNDIVLAYNQPLKAPGDKAAVVMYTSGTTGVPKGVTLPALSLFAHGLSMANMLSLETHDRVLWFASTGADITLEQLLAPLSVGACVVIPEHMWAMSEFLPNAARYGVTVADLPPIYCQWLMRASEKQKQAWLASSLRIILLGGEAMPLSIIEGWQQMQLQHTLQLYNAYGPTETTITASVYPIDASFKDLKVSLGTATDGNRFFVLDTLGNPVPPGVEGTLFISGERLADGYLFAPEKTSEAFVHSPDGQRMYNTGDRVKYFPNGTLWFVGRHDSQVKIRGYRVELDSVQRYLEAREEFYEAVVLQHRTENRQSLIAFVVAANGSPELAQRTLKAMRADLPHYMVVHTIELVDHIPLTANGKVDSQVLLARVNKVEQPVSSFTGNALKVAGLIKQVLGQMPQSGDQTFYELGGDSLQALQLISLVNARFCVDIPLQQLLANSSVDDLTALIEQGNHDEAGGVVCLSQSDTMHVMLCVPGAGGTAGDFAALAKHLGDYSLFALQAPGLQSGAIPSSFEQWLDYAVHSVKDLPRSPVVLIGHSMGGWLAAHIRRKIFPDAKLLLLDSYVNLFSSEDSEQFVAKQVHKRLAGMSLDFDLPPNDDFDQLEIALSKQIALGDKSGTRLWLNLLRLTRAQLKMKPEWRSGLGDITLVNAQRSVAERGPARSDWSSFASIDEIIISGGHYDVISHPEVPSIVRRVLLPKMESHCQ